MELSQTLQLTPWQHQCLNQEVWLYLGVTWISKLSNQEGAHIRTHDHNHRGNIPTNKPTLTKAYQKCPNAASRKIMDRVINKITEQDKTTFKQQYTLW